MATGVRVKGLRELQRDIGRVDKQLRSELGKELKKLAEPVAADASRRVARFGEKTAAGIVAGRRGGGAVVRQRLRKVTGKRGDFGALQMRTALIPALEAHEEEVVHGVEDLLDRLTSEAGLGGGGLP